jgi:Rieske Fe-S protein
MSVQESDRRSFLARAVIAGTGLITAGLAGLVALVAAPVSKGPAKRWRKAASVFSLPADAPFTAVLASREDDGWYATRKESVIFIDREGDGYRAMSSTCAHLGCRVKWEGAKQEYHCPCHGGVYDREGRVVSGPPPHPLDRLNVRVNPKTSDIEVEL